MIHGVVASQRRRVAGSEYRVAVTVPAASVTESLVGFPVYIDLASMPSEFWSVRPHKDGRDVRVKTAGGVDLPFHLVRVNPGARDGSLFVRLDLSSSVPTTCYIHWGDASLSAVSGAPVWSDYHRVYLFSNGDQSDQTGSGASAGSVGRNKRFGLVSQSPALTEHQGVCSDGTFYYVVDTNAINKYDHSWSLVGSNTNPVGDVGGGVNHCGDPDIHNGMLYVPIENYSSPTVFSAQKVAVFRADTLAFVTAHDVSAQGAEVSGVCIDADAGHLYTVAYTPDGFSAEKYNLSTMAFIGSITGSATPTYVQGMTKYRGRLYANADGQDYTYLLSADFSGATRQWTDIADNATTRSGNYEGIGSTGDHLLALRDDGATSVIHVISPLSVEAGGGMDIVQSPEGVSRLQDTAVTDYSTFTMGATAIPDAITGVGQALLSYTAPTTAQTSRVTLAIRSTGFIGVWDATNGWTLDTAPTVAGEKYRVHARYSASDRALFVNGQKFSGARTSVPAGKTNLLMGVEDQDYVEKFDGKIGFVYLRQGELSDQWIAAETSNLENPGAFYAVGAAEPA